MEYGLNNSAGEARYDIDQIPNMAKLILEAGNHASLDTTGIIRRPLVVYEQDFLTQY